MTKDETLKIMAMLSAYYGRPKANSTDMANAWHLILAKYDYQMACNAVVAFAENDTRDYATFPAPGVIVKIIRQECSKSTANINEVLTGVTSGKSWINLSPEARSLVNEDRYNTWLNGNMIAFIANQGFYKNQLRTGQAKLLEG